MTAKDLIPVLFVAAFGLPCAAQTVYESKDKSGATVFSDRPTTGAKSVDLPPPNVIQTPGSSAPGPAPVAAAPYASVAIASPENEGTIHSNTGDFQIRLRSTPALRAGAGDRYRVKVDGRLLAPKYSSRTVSIRAADWAGAANDDARHTLQVAIVDRQGNKLVESAPVGFHLRRATVRR